MKTPIKKSLLILLVALLLLCYALLAMGSEDDDSTTKTTEQKDDRTVEQTAEQTATPPVKITIPDFVGMTMTQAKSAASSAGVTVTSWPYKQGVIPYDQAWEYAKDDYGNKPNLWKVTAQASTGTNAVALSIDLNVINTNNNPDFHTILNEDNARSSSFVSNHKGELVEFVGIIRITEQNSTYNYTYTIYGFDDARTHVGELFCFSNIDYHAVRLCTDNFSKVDTVSYFHIVAEIKGFDNNKGILLKPVGIDYIGPAN